MKTPEQYFNMPQLVGSTKVVLLSDCIETLARVQHDVIDEIRLKVKARFSALSRNHDQEEHALRRRECKAAMAECEKVLKMLDEL